MDWLLACSVLNQNLSSLGGMNKLLQRINTSKVSGYKTVSNQCIYIYIQIWLKLKVGCMSCNCELCHEYPTSKWTPAAWSPGKNKEQKIRPTIKQWTQSKVRSPESKQMDQGAIICLKGVSRGTEAKHDKKASKSKLDTTEHWHQNAIHIKICASDIQGTV